MRDILPAQLATRGFLIADGAMGTSLFTQGLETGDSPEFWNIDHPDRVRATHRGFLEAGADIVLTNSFGGTGHRLKLHAAGHRVHTLNLAAARLARAAVEDWAAGTGRRCLVAGSMGPSGELFEPLGALTHQAGVAAFAEQAMALAEGGVDILWIETLSSIEEMSAAVEGAGRTGLPVICTMTFDTNARTMMGLDAAGFAERARSLTPRPVAVGANCGVGPAELVQTIGELHTADPEAVIVAKGNCGIPQYVDGGIVYSGSPEVMAEYARLARDAGARIIGGCCGSTPAHIRAMAAALDGYTPLAPPTPERIADRLGRPWQQGGRLRDTVPEALNTGAPRRRRRRRAPV